MLLDFSRHEYPEQYCVPETDFDKEVLAFLRRWRAEQHFSIQTSGSTGTPKRITHSKTAMQNSAKLTGNYFNFKQGQKALLCLPIHKIAGIMMLVRAIVWKMQLYTIPPKLKLDLSNLPTLDFAPLLPSQAIQSFDELAKIQTVLLGGVSLPQQLLMQIKGHSSQFFHSYGMTETISHIAICNLQKNVNIYSVLPEIAISVNAENCLRIDALMLEVKNLQTNDIVELLTEKTFRFLGRIDSVINSGGLKIIAEDVERQLSDYISQPFYITGTADDKLGEKVTLFIEGDAWQEDKIKALKAQFQRIVPKQAVPRTIIFQEKFSYTETGKVKR